MTSDKNAGLMFRVKRWNMGDLSEQDTQDLCRCVDFRVRELRYAGFVTRSRRTRRMTW